MAPGFQHIGYVTNNTIIYYGPTSVALLYKYRWQVELFFKWIKQHLRVKTFWGESENAVRIQIHVVIITYCLVGTIEHDMQIGRPIVEIMRILGSSLLTMDDVRDLFEPFKRTEDKHDDRQLSLDFKPD